MTHRFRPTRPLALLLALLALGCDSTQGTTASIRQSDQSLSILGGQGQATAINTPLLTSLTVKAVDPSGNPVAGISVTWQVTTGGGSLAPATGTTNNDGLVSSNYTAGEQPGPVVVTASASGFTPATFSITVTASAAADR